MTREATTTSGVILLTVPTIQYGGLLDNPLPQNFFRASYAHAG